MLLGRKFYQSTRKLLITAGLITFGLFTVVSAQDETDPDAEEAARRTHYERIEADIQAGSDEPEAPALASKPCVGGQAGGYPCKNVDLMAFLPLSALGGGVANDIWGWTDPLDGNEYAILGRSSGTFFVDITDPARPVYLGNLPTHTTNSDWRDIKIYKNRAYIVSEAPNHGMQVFDLRELRTVTNPPVTFKEETHYNAFGHAHNIAINEETGYAYAVGTNTCSGGLHIINIKTPHTPLFVSCFSGDGYTHDAQCVVYRGPDQNYNGAEICFAYNENTLTIVDVTRKQSIVMLSRQGYPGAQYTHQGWITEDHAYLLLGDESDELVYGHNTRTRIWTISNLKKPGLIGVHDGVNRSIDHNMYIFNGMVFQSNYTSGLQILATSNIQSGILKQVGFFDTYPASNGPEFKGSWSNFPFFDSGVVIVSSINEGLFVLKPVPSIVVSPAALVSMQHPDRNTAMQLTIENTGIGTLNWQVSEDIATPAFVIESPLGCAAPQDVPWLNIPDPAGQSLPGAAAQLQIWFNSAGLAPGTYHARLCISSDDPANSLVEVPVTLEVTDWPEVFLPLLLLER